MIELFGKDPAMAGALLEWLQVLSEEYCSNMRLEVKNDFGRDGAKRVERGTQVVSLLSMYVSASGEFRSFQLLLQAQLTLFDGQASPAQGSAKYETR